MPEPSPPPLIDNPWPKFTTPAKGAAQAIGNYTAGCIVGSEELPLSGPGYHVMHPTTGKRFGHPTLIHYVKNLGKQVHRDKLGTLLLGNLNLVRGGPTLVGHMSHQSGLDIDIWFWLTPEANRPQLTAQEREDWGAKSVVNLKTYKVLKKLWTPKHVKILKYAAQAPEVERIFVHAAVKRALCQATRGKKSERKWMAKVRPWFEHHDHFHVRLRCPEGSPLCKKQEAIPPGDGCGSELDWWFSDEARQKTASPERKAEAFKMPKLPPECEGVRAQAN
ncbi:MAG: penicillin-insensitive murein endopeptidase [Bacteriovoracia bacterium]